MWAWLLATSTALYDATNLAVILDPLALLKKDSQIRAYQCHPAPHRCGGQVQYQVNGLTYVVLSSPRTLVKNGRSVCMELSQFPTRPSTSVQKIKVAIMRCAPGVTRKHEQRLLLKGRSTPYPPNKEKGTYDDESDRSLSSLSSVRELMLEEAKAKFVSSFLRELMFP